MQIPSEAKRNHAQSLYIKQKGLQQLMKKSASVYRVYTLRLWVETTDDGATEGKWRYSLEDAQTRRRYGFRKLGQLVRFLESQTETALPDGPP